MRMCYKVCEKCGVYDSVREETEKILSDKEILVKYTRENVV